MKQTDEAVFKKKLLELASRANGSGRCTFTPFLGLAEQNILRCAEKELSGVIRTEFGGADGCERIMVRFGDPEDCGYACPFPIRCIRAIPRSKKFAEQLTHRDILGSLMALGIDRNRTGDIAVRENEIYIFCTEQIAPYIAENFVSARRTDPAAIFCPCRTLWKRTVRPRLCCRRNCFSPFAPCNAMLQAKGLMPLQRRFSACRAGAIFRSCCEAEKCL